MRSALPLIAATALLAGCSVPSVGRSVMPDDPLAAPATAGDAVVAPVIVARRLLAAGEPELALGAFVRAGTEDGLTSEIRLGMASANLALGRAGQAERLLRDILEEEPGNARAMNDLGVVLLHGGDATEARGLLRAAFAAHPTEEIRRNLRIAIEGLDRPTADAPSEAAYRLMRRRDGVYRLAAP